MAVSLIESVSAPYGAGVVLDGTGILLNNRMAGFNTDESSDNCVAPGKRPANTLAPCLVMKDGKLVMSVGTPGTVGQTCTLAQFLARVLACGEDPAAAASVPRWSVDFQGKLVVEDTMAPVCAKRSRRARPRCGRCAKAGSASARSSSPPTRRTGCSASPIIAVWRSRRMVGQGMVNGGMQTALISAGYASIRNSILPRAAALLTIRAKSRISATEKNDA